MTVSGWPGVLDAYEARLAAQRAGLDSGDVEVAPFEPPAGLGPLPADLADRAARLLADARVLEAELAERLAAAEPAAHSGERATPAYLDQRV